MRVEKKGAARIEQLANSFAGALLMPRASLNVLVDQSKKADVRHLLDVATKLQVSTEALGWRLLRLEWIDDATRLALRELKVPAERDETPKPFSSDYVQLLHTALDRGWLSARKAAKSMGMTLGQLSGLFAAHKLSAPFEL